MQRDKWFLTKMPDSSVEKGLSLEDLVLEQLNIHMPKNPNLDPYFAPYIKLTGKTKCQT